MSERNPSFLQAKYKLGVEPINNPEIGRIAERTKAKTGVEVKKPEERIQNYLDYITESLDPKDPVRREEKLRQFKQSLYDKNVIKPDEVPEAYFNTQRRLAREQGHGDLDISNEQRKQLTEVIITDQKSSLDNWVDYLASPDATYPDWLKYWATRSILSMGEYDKEKKQFTKRRKDTVKPFPDLDREALSYVLDAMGKKYSSKGVDLESVEEDDRKQFEQLLQTESFPKLYAWAIEKVTPVSPEQLSDTAGKWIKYPKGSDHTLLVKSLQGHGTGWCTAGESMARTQLNGGDFYVFYSLDPKGQPTVPRAAIRMQEGSIAEVRGVGPDQNLDPHIGKVVQDKLAEFPDGKLYEKKSGDMKKLTEIENKIKKGQELNRLDLVFLYEIDSKIQGFGYEKDPRIQEVIEMRDSKADAPIVFDCEPEQIAWGKNEIDENTKAYVGPLFSNIFQQLKHLEHIYTAFPEGRIVRSTVEIGGQTKEELQAEMKKKNIQISTYAQSTLGSRDFATLKKFETADLVRLKVGDFNLQNPTTENIYKKAEELGLELCPAEVGPHYRLQYADQPADEYLYIGMKQIVDSSDDPDVFELDRHGSGLWLNSFWPRPTREWDSNNGFVFRLRK